jgi:CheY-like chemotaxis protein
LAVMSHEIRTPLNAIIGLGELAAESDSDQERIEFLQTIQENSETLLSLISEILDFSKIEAGQIEIEQIEFNLTETVENVLDLLAFKAFAKGLELILQIDKTLPETIIGDSTRLRQILINLIGNAIKFTPRGEVFVSLKPESYTSPDIKILFSVKDTGIGIPDDKKSAIFDRFNQADISTTRKYGGTGLGLSICKSLVKLMNGEIGVKDNLENGSEFYFSLDFEIGTHTRPFEFADKLSNLNLLIVEGNKSAKSALTEIFSADNPNLLFTANASESIKAIEKNKFDIAVIENDLPMIEGQSLAQLIKINSANLIKIILLSNNIREKTENDLIDKYVSKPFKKADLLNAIAEVSGWVKIDSGPKLQLDENQPEIISGKILLAEDNKPNQILACRIIEKAGYEIDVASNGAEAVAMFLAGKYDLILMDIEMPEMDGFQATEQIRTSETNTNIPIIALTAHAIEGYREKCLAFGMNDYITKPLRREHLLKTVRHFLAKNTPDLTLTEEPEVTAYIDEDIMDLVPDYLESCRKCILSLKDLIATNNFKAIQKIGHDLKGSGRGYGFENITLAGSLIESNAKNLNPDKIIKAVADMEVYINEVKVVLK